MNDAKPFFIVKNLSHAYGKGTPLENPSLNGLNMEVQQGEVVGVIGPTGSGKSTLLQHLCGLIRPQTGQVWVEGVDMSATGADLKQARQRIGMVFQLPEDQLFERYAGDDVAFGPRNQGLDRETIRRRVKTAMESVGLPFEDFKDRLVLTLSGGERRKVALAGVLAMEPVALLLDEPTAGLDPVSRQDLLNQLKTWHKQRHLTMIISSHNMDDLAFLAGRIYVLKEGRNVLAGSTREVFAQASTLRELGLEAPSMAALTETLAEAGLPVQLGALSIKEAADAIEALWKDVEIEEITDGRL